MLPPADSAAAITASRSAFDRTFCASVTPRNSSLGVAPMPASAANFSAPHRTSAMPPVWKKTVSSTSRPHHPSS